MNSWKHRVIIRPKVEPITGRVLGFSLLGQDRRPATYERAEGVILPGPEQPRPTVPIRHFGTSKL